MTEKPDKKGNQRAVFTYNGDVSAALAHFSKENRKVENALANLSRHEQSFVAARKEVLGKIKKTRRRQSWRLRKGLLWLRWLGAQRILVELRIALTNTIALILFLIGWLMMMAMILALAAFGLYVVFKIAAFGLYMVFKIVEGLLNG